ncbi:Na(+)-translocating NADH-quinone reductase subunit F [Candidatus Brocadiaceae bacterium B188]|nr:2Fe-2S iron-sulfur cluster binding domain-containing protein [Candidatus Brocadia sapporoensis]RZV58450.1 MAG: 2Fe-2S iron-sulfur cluster binding domain-containing protein [Candidatus Brocadia sp. BROELEC01]TWU54176.1 Na(+)-translocating NADH-quinone reductase subunit F [Candidatus Brocadiaceae bacterium B188]
MITSLLLGAGILSFLVLLLSIFSEIIYQFFGRGEKRKLTIVSDDEYKKELDIEGGEKLLSLLQNRGFNIPAACGGMATCGQCKVKLHTNVGTYTAVETPHFDMRTREAARKFLEQGTGDGYTRLACQVRVDKDVSLYLPKDTLHVRKYTARVIKKRAITSDKMEMWLLPSRPIQYKPGQYIQLAIPEDFVEEYYKKYENFIKEACKLLGKEFIPYVPGTTLYRGYSLASTEPDLLKLIVRMAPSHPTMSIEKGGPPCIGPACVHNYLLEKSLWNFFWGEKIRFTGPYGHFTLKEEPHTAVFVAGGAGLAPILALLEQWFREGRQDTAIFFLGERRFQDIPMIYLPKWLIWQQKNPQFKLVPVLSGAFRGDNPVELNDIDKQCYHSLSLEAKLLVKERGFVDNQEKQWKGEIGFIGPLLRKYLSPDQDIVFYLCGPSPMTVTVIDAAANQLNLKKEHALFDDFTGTLTPSVDLIYQKLEIKETISRLNLPDADKFIERISQILIIQLILKDKIEESYRFLELVRESLGKSVQELESVFSAYKS